EIQISERADGQSLASLGLFGRRVAPVLHAAEKIQRLAPSVLRRPQRPVFPDCEPPCSGSDAILEHIGFDTAGLYPNPEAVELSIPEEAITLPLVRDGGCIHRALCDLGHEVRLGCRVTTA